MISLYLSQSDTNSDKILFIYNNFYSFMAYTAGQVLGNDTFQIEDAIHSAMVKIIENIDLIDLTDLNSAKNFCGIIAKNKARDMRKRSHSRDISLENEAVSAIPSANDPSDAVIRKSTYDLLMDTIYSLDDIYRDVCVLKFVNELKNREIAKVLDIPIRTVNTRIYRAKRKLTEMIGKENMND